MCRAPPRSSPPRGTSISGAAATHAQRCDHGGRGAGRGQNADTQPHKKTNARKANRQKDTQRQPHERPRGHRWQPVCSPITCARGRRGSVCTGDRPRTCNCWRPRIRPLRARAVRRAAPQMHVKHVTMRVHRSTLHWDRPTQTYRARHVEKRFGMASLIGTVGCYLKRRCWDLCHAKCDRQWRRSCQRRYTWPCTKCRDPGSNRGPSDLRSDALPTELSRRMTSFWDGSHINWHIMHLNTHARRRPVRQPTARITAAREIAPGRPRGGRGPGCRGSGGIKSKGRRAKRFPNGPHS